MNVHKLQKGITNVLVMIVLVLSFHDTFARNMKHKTEFPSKQDSS